MWFIRDACGIICALFTYVLMIGTSIIVVLVCINPLEGEGYFTEYIHTVIYAGFLILAGLAHLVCMFSNPGTLEKGSYDPPPTEESDVKPPHPVCKHCHCLKSPQVHHCSTCGRCIDKMDHHCPWVNNCVGRSNQKHFVLFLLYIFLACLYSMVMMAYRVMYCVGERPRSTMFELCRRTKTKQILDMFLGILAFFICLLFGIFTCVMMYDQMSCIVTNTTGIDELKKTPVEKRPLKVNLEEAFGGRFGIHWFLPTPVAKDGNIKLQ